MRAERNGRRGTHPDRRKTGKERNATPEQRREMVFEKSFATMGEGKSMAPER